MSEEKKRTKKPRKHTSKATTRAAKKATKKRTTKKVERKKRAYRSGAKTTRKQSTKRTITPEERGSHGESMLSLALLSPYRLPVEAEKLTVYTARVAGFAFVLVGVFATYFFIEQEATKLATKHVHSARVGGATLDEAPTASALAFSYSRKEDGTPTRMQVHIKTAREVHVQAYDVSTGTYQFLGTATKDDDHVWGYDFTDSALTSGTYWMKVVVFTKDGAYDRSDNQLITIR